jgi:hypothetical protein
VKGNFAPAREHPRRLGRSPGAPPALLGGGARGTKEISSTRSRGAVSKGGEGRRARANYPHWGFCPQSRAATGGGRRRGSRGRGGKAGRAKRRRRRVAAEPDEGRRRSCSRGNAVRVQGGTPFVFEVKPDRSTPWTPTPTPHRQACYAFTVDPR